MRIDHIIGYVYISSAFCSLSPGVMQASAPVDMPDVPVMISEAVAESASGQDRSSIIVVVTSKKDFYIPRNAAEHRLRARNHDAEQQLHQLQWSVEETCKFASAEVVLSKI